MQRALRENGATAVSMAAISYTLLHLGHVVTAMLILEAWLLVLSLVWAGMFLLQRFLVRKRRCSDHWFVQYGAMAGYYLPAPVTFSAASALYYSTSHVFPLLMFGVLFMFCCTIFASSIRGMAFTNMRSYSLRDRPGDRYSFLRWLVLFVFVQWEWARISWLVLLEMFICTILVAFGVLFEKPPESTLDCQTKAVADYMMQRKSSKSSSTSPFFDDDANDSLQLDCCRYPFVQGKDGEWVTLKDLVQRDDLPNEDRDIWLSYSLSRLLARRYYGFHPAEEGDDKVRRFVLADLGRTNNGYKRAFNIVEMQLAFLHDYFFTTSLPLIESGVRYIEAAQLLPLLFATIIFIFLACAAAIPGVRYVLLVDDIQSLVLGVLVMFISQCILFGMPMSLLVRNILAFYWRPIHTAFRKLNYYLPIGCPTPITSVVSLFRASPNPNTQYVFDPFQTKAGGAYWRNKIGQYSILQDYDRRRSLKKALVAWFQEIMLSQPSYEFIKHLPVQEEEIDMQRLDRMRELVAKTLWAIDGPPTNGTRSLKINMGSSGYDWSWTCRQETHTDTILIWHIATCYCGMTPPHGYRHNGLRLVEIDTWYEVATALSRYCAYLVAFLPEFLPDHILTTKQVFQNVIQDAQRALGSTHIEEKEKHTMIRGICLRPRRGQTTFHKGIMLGRQLEKLNTWLRWKVMAEFWAETILYVAPSDNAAAHMEHLAKGGEFITHLWALLSNAGILKRATGEWHPPPASTTTEGPPTPHQLTEALSSSIDEASTSYMSFLPRQTSEPPTNEKGRQLLEDHDQ